MYLNEGGRLHFLEHFTTLRQLLAPVYDFEWGKYFNTTVILKKIPKNDLPTNLPTIFCYVTRNWGTFFGFSIFPLALVFSQYFTPFLIKYWEILEKGGIFGLYQEFLESFGNFWGKDHAISLKSKL